MGRCSTLLVFCSIVFVISGRVMAGGRARSRGSARAQGGAGIRGEARVYRSGAMGEALVTSENLFGNSSYLREFRP